MGKKVTILNSREQKILEKFKDGGDIKSDDEWDILEKYASLGFVSFGFLSKRARLTKEGKFVLAHNSGI